MGHCLLDKTQPGQSLTHSSCGYLHKSYTHGRHEKGKEKVERRESSGESGGEQVMGGEIIILCICTRL